MKIRSIGILISILFICIPPVYAEPQSQATSEDNIAKLLARTQVLEKEVKSLKAKVASDEGPSQTNSQKSDTKTLKVAANAAAQQPSSSGLLPYSNYVHKPTTQSTEPAGFKPKKEIPVVVEGQKFLVRRIHIPSAIYFGGTPVITSPYLGIRSEFDGTDLIVNIPSVNEDLRILRQMVKLRKVYEEHEIPYPNHPYLELSGKVEVQSYLQTPYTGPRQTDVNIAGAEVDALPIINQWAFGLMTFNFDNSTPTAGPITREFNSRVYMNKVFFTVGNLSASPFYVSGGQMYVPFGVYSSNMLSSPLTSFISKTLARAALVGFSQGDKGLYASAYTFHGGTGVGGTVSRLNNGGVNAGYIYKKDKFSLDFGGGWIANITDSLGMQDNGQPTSPSQFAGFAVSSNTEALQHRVPGANVRGTMSIGDWGLIAEYVAATTQYSYNNLFYNTHGARPKAFNVEGSYSFTTFTKPSSFAVGYQQSNQALALSIPEYRAVTAYNIALMKDTIFTVEYRHDVNYRSADSAGGGGGGGAALPFITNGQTGHTLDLLTVQFGIYF